MMRTLLDRLLFALPSPPSRASLVRGGLYLLFGLLLYGLFLGVLYMRELGVVGLRQWCGRLPGVQVSMSRPEMSFFPPALEIADLTVQPPNASEPLAFRNVRSGLHVKGGTSEGIPDAYPDFAFVFEGLERPFRHEFLPYLFKRDAQGGLHVHAAGGEIARNEGDLPLNGARKHGTPHGELMQGQPFLFPAGFHCAFQLVQAGTLEYG